MKKILSAIIFLLLLVRFNDVLAQAPAISYVSPQTYFLGTTITALSPANTGGPVSTSNSALVSTFVGNIAGGTGIAPSFDPFFGEAFDASGNLYVSDQGNNLIRKITPAGVITTLAGSGAAGAVNGPGTTASFNSPAGLAVDGPGNVYVADRGNNLIRKITPAGVVTTLAGSGASGSTDGTGAAASFNFPNGVAVDALGNVYVADSQNSLIRKITPAGVVTTLAGAGGSGNADGTGAAAKFNIPTGLTIDGSGNLYVADTFNNSIRKVTPSGVVTTIVNVLAATGSGSFLTGIALDLLGNIYVADTQNNQIKKVAPDGTLTTFAGSGLAGSTNGIDTAASFNAPTGIAVDTLGNIFVADFSNNLIRKIITLGYTIRPALPAGLVFDATTGIISGTPTVVSPATNYTVTAANLSGEGVATVNIRVLSQTNNAELANMQISPGFINPQFPGGEANGITNYSASVAFVTTAVNVTPTASDPAATITVNGITTASGSPSASIPVLVGVNTVTIIVTAEDGTTTKTYTIAVTRAAPSSNAGLSTINSTIGPFCCGTSFTALVANAVTDIVVTPNAIDPNATITVNGISIPTDFPSPNIPLSIGPNIITIVVTAQDGITTQTYTITVTRAATASVNLADLTVSNGSLTPSFTAGTTHYDVSVGNAITSITITPTAVDATASINVNGSIVASGTPSVPLFLGVGPNIFSIIVSEVGLLPRTYFVNVIRTGLSNNADLSDLTISVGPLTPVFASGITSYTSSVSNGVMTTRVTPTVSDPSATVTVNGVTVVPGLSSTNIPLAVGANTITTVVTASDQTTTKTYTITVTRVAPANANLANLTISSGTLAPAFASGTTNYTASVSNVTTSVTLTPTASDPAATVTVNGVATASGSSSAAISLVVGANTITTIVTAGDGTTTNTYTVIATRAGGTTNAGLTNLKISKGTLSPAFASGTTSYTANISNATTSITVTPYAADHTATITVNGATVASGSPSQGLPVAVGPNTITIVVTKDSTAVSYTLTVNRGPSENALLANLQLSKGTLSPAFASGTFSYTARAARTTTGITVTPTTADASATVTVNGIAVTSGTASPTIPLSAGVNNITIVVTAQNGTVSKIYSLAVTKEAGTVASLFETVSIADETGGDQPAADGIKVHQAVSPNGDGMNDVLTIDNIQNYPDNKLTLVNRNGVEIYRVSGYDNVSRVFDGRSNITGALQQPGTYFYLLEYKDKGETKQETGYFVLKY
jgi:gliding motility-associated-like protein